MITGSIIIFHLSKVWKAKFFLLCDAIFLHWWAAEGISSLLGVMGQIGCGVTGWGHNQHNYKPIIYLQACWRQGSVTNTIWQHVVRTRNEGIEESTTELRNFYERIQTVQQTNAYLHGQLLQKWTCCGLQCSSPKRCKIKHVFRSVRLTNTLRRRVGSAGWIAGRFAGCLNF